MSRPCRHITKHGSFHISPHRLFSPDLHAKVTNQPRLTQEGPSPRKETQWTFLSLSGVGLAKSCAHVGSAQYIFPLEIHDGISFGIPICTHGEPGSCSSGCSTSYVHCHIGREASIICHHNFYLRKNSLFGKCSTQLRESEKKFKNMLKKVSSRLERKLKIKN